MSGDYQSMFDNDLSTLWVGNKWQPNKVVVTFKKHVLFYDISIIARSVKMMCVVLDGSWDGRVIVDSAYQFCTSADYDDSEQEIILQVNKKRISAKKIELLVANGVAQIADLKIHYIGTLTGL